MWQDLVKSFKLSSFITYFPFIPIFFLGSGFCWSGIFLSRGWGVFFSRGLTSGAGFG